MKYMFSLLTLIFMNSCYANQKTSYKTRISTGLKYIISMPNPHTHYFEVEMEIPIKNTVLEGSSEIELRMPVWTPGSYLVREFSKNVEGFQSFSPKNESLKTSKNRKNRWKVVIPKDLEKIIVKYSVYAFELTVRTSYLDDEHGYINGTSVFMYVEELKDQEHILKINPHPSFKRINVALKNITENQYVAENYDLLVDSPIEIGNQEVLSFEAMGVPHTIAIFNPTSVKINATTLLIDFKKIVSASASVFKTSHPCHSYLFVIHLVPNTGGGLEHLNSTTCQSPPSVFSSDDQYTKFLSLIGHEYFHLWNVKRLRPAPLGPFDYENENYTHMLWVSEGFTSYYQENILKKAGYYQPEEYLRTMAYKIGSTENQAGNQIQSVAESSFDAWIKFYRPNENSDNSTISYYTKGGVIASFLNLVLVDKTGGKQNLDNLMSNLYQKYFIEKNRGFSNEEFIAEAEAITGSSLSDFFDQYVFGTKTPDYASFFEKCGIKYTAEKISTPVLGIVTRGNRVTHTIKGSGAYENGVYVNDEILAVDGVPYSPSEKLLPSDKKIGEKVELTLLRNGIEKKYSIAIKEDTKKRITLEEIKAKTSEQKIKYKKFME